MAGISSIGEKEQGGLGKQFDGKWGDPTKDVVDLKPKTIAAAEVNKNPIKNPIKKRPTTIGCTYPF
jgi:hypothetical protein